MLSRRFRAPRSVPGPLMMCVTASTIAGSASSAPMPSREKAVAFCAESGLNTPDARALYRSATAESYDAIAKLPNAKPILKELGVWERYSKFTPIKELGERVLDFPVMLCLGGMLGLGTKETFFGLLGTAAAGVVLASYEAISAASIKNSGAAALGVMAPLILGWAIGTINGIRTNQW